MDRWTNQKLASFLTLRMEPRRTRVLGVNLTCFAISSPRWASGRPAEGGESAGPCVLSTRGPLACGVPSGPGSERDIHPRSEPDFGAEPRPSGPRLAGRERICRSAKHDFQPSERICRLAPKTLERAEPGGIGLCGRFSAERPFGSPGKTPMLHTRNFRPGVGRVGRSARFSRVRTMIKSSARRLCGADEEAEPCPLIRRLTAITN